MFGSQNHNQLDSDDELRIWHEVQAESAIKLMEDNLYHRCPPYMPPCPNCQELYDIEDELTVF